MPYIIKVAADDASRAYGWFAATFSLNGAPSAIIVDKARVKTLARLNAALNLIGPGPGGAAGNAYLRWGQQGNFTGTTLSDRLSARENEGRVPDVGPFTSAAFGSTLRDPSMVMFTCQSGWTATNVAESIQQGPVIGGYGVAIVIDPEAASAYTVFSTGKAGVMQALTGVLA